jgi:site-specific recombinase XerD
MKGIDIMENELIVIDDFEPLVELTIKGIVNPNTQRSYRRCVLDFLRWWAKEGKPQFSKDLILKYRLEISRGKWAISTINQHINVIHKLAMEALDAGLMTPEAANGIARVKGLKLAGTRAGNWLTIEQSEQLINAPDSSSPIGIRDRAIISILLGAGLRRSEVANLKIEDIQQREGRWCIVDLLGKGNRIRTVPIPDWVHQAIDAWALTGKVYSGILFYPMDRVHGRQARKPITPQGIFVIARFYAKRCGLKISPHDCRRTFGKLSYKGGSDIVQIQASLGHSNPQTTLRYLGDVQDYQDAPADHLGLNI